MPFDILALVEKDETLATCQIFNAEVCYGSGLRFDTCIASTKVKSEVEDFCLDNDLATYFLGVCREFARTSLASASRSNTYGSAISALILNKQGDHVVRLLRKG